MGNKQIVYKFYEQINCVLKDAPSNKPVIVLDSSDYDVDKAGELSNSGELQRYIPSSSNNLKTNEDNTDDNSNRIINLFTTNSKSRKHSLCQNFL